MKKILSILSKILTVFFVIILLVILVQRVTRNSFAIGGVRIFTIVSESMKPAYLIGDILVSQEAPPEDLKIGDHVTYLGREGQMTGLVVTHEIIEKREENGKYYFIVKGIANDLPDPEISEEDIYGKVIYKTVIFSFFSRLMNNPIVYYGSFVVVAIYFSYQIVSGFIFNKDGGDLNKREEESENDEDADSKESN